eukprot:1137001-Pelagomonas_calceolata.AAC.1
MAAAIAASSALKIVLVWARCCKRRKGMLVQDNVDRLSNMLLVTGDVNMNFYSSIGSMQQFLQWFAAQQQHFTQ